MAAAYLEERGYSILERNKRTPYGEIDLIARYGDCLVFVEVKTRASTSLGLPEISISNRKREHLLAAAQAYLQARPEPEGIWRIDLVAIRRLARQPVEIAHFENILTDDGVRP